MPHLSRVSAGQYQRVLIPKSVWACSVSVEAAKGVPLETVVGRANVGVIGHHEVVAAHLVHHLRDHGAVVCLGEPGQLCGLKKLVIVLDGDHVMELGSKGNAHLVDLSLKRLGNRI